MPESGMGNATRHPIIDPWLAPKATAWLWPSSARDFPDMGSYRSEMPAALECESSRIDTPFSGLTIYLFPP
jgi:hypothetical protein